jgi:molybdopterin converting factor small subunit
MARTVSVKLFGLLERAAGRRETSVEVEDGTTVLDVLNRVAERCGREFTRSVFSAPGRLHAHLRVFVNEEEVETSDRLPAGDRPTELALLVLRGFEGGSR